MAGACDLDEYELARDGVTVVKYGAGTGRQTAHVSSIGQEVYYVGGDDDTVFHATDQIQIRTAERERPFAIRSDSGAPVLIANGESQRRLMGQVVCGNLQGGRSGFTFVTPITAILDRFDASLVPAK